MGEKLHPAAITLFTLIALMAITTLRSFSSSTTILTFSPLETVSVSGQPLTVNLSLNNVANLNAWQITVSFNPKILNCITAWIPENNIFKGYTIISPTPKIDNTKGQITMFAAIEESVGVSGSGILCTIQFEAKTLGACTLTFLNPMKFQLDGTYLQDPNYNLIPFETTIGVVQIKGSNFTENTFTINYGTETLKIKTLSNSTISNLNYDPTTETLYYTATGPDGTKGACIITIPQKIMNTTLIVLSDNTPLKTFIEELNTLPKNGTHNFLYYAYTHTTHTIKILQTTLGDITGDRIVDVLDVAITSKSFGLTPTSPNYRPVADINQDEIVDIQDIAIISRNFGKSFPPE